MRSQLDFLKNYARDIHVGAIAHSSKYVIRAALRKIHNKPMNRVIEYGPGDGVLTRELLIVMPKDGRLLAIETNPIFLGMLRSIDDPRLQVIDGKVQNISKDLLTGAGSYDLIISSIPFSLIKVADSEKIVHNTYDLLTKTGMFIIFHQYSHLMSRLMKKYFRSISISFEPRNVWPCFMICAQKESLLAANSRSGR